MTTYITQSIEGVNLSAIYTAYDQTAATSSSNDPSNPGPPFTVGTEVVCTDGSIWMFVKVATSATLAQYNCVGIDVSAFTATPTVGGATYEATKKRVGFYQNSTSATAAQYCWVMLSGAPTVLIAASAAKAVQLYTTDTSGVLDDGIATGSQYPVRNVFLLTTSGSTASNGVANASWPAFGPQTALI